LHRGVDAKSTWKHALNAGNEAAQAAAFGLAELHLTDPTPGPSLALYERALRPVASFSAFHNALMDVAEARSLVEQGYRHYLELAEYAHARQLAHLYDRIAPPGVGQELIGQALDAWANNCLERAHPRGKQVNDALLEEAYFHFREAGGAYQAAADARQGEEQARLLWLSADRFWQGKGDVQAAPVLERFLKIETVPEQLGEGWHRLGEVYQALHKDREARAAFRKCIEFPGKFAFRARYRLAQLDIERKLWDDAESALLHNLELMRPAPDDEAYEKSLFTLAELLVQREKYRLAAHYFQEAVDRYPGHERTTAARKQLADCYWRLAAQEDRNLRQWPLLTDNARFHYREERRRWLQMARAHYQKLVDDLSARSATASLSAADESLLSQAGLAAGECAFELSHYQDAVAAYEQALPLVAVPERLEALKQITRCFWLMHQREQAVATLARIRALLHEAPAGALDVLVRQEWEKWLEWADKQ
jgi:tetratricopeptide (TPR) repeat protein